MNKTKDRNNSEQQKEYLIAVISQTDGRRKSEDGLSNPSEARKRAKSLSQQLEGGCTVFIYENSQDNPVYAGSFSSSDNELQIEKV